MKIICPHCKRVTELEHVSHGCNVECVCSREFKVDDSSILEEYSEIDSIIPERIGQYEITEFIGYGGMGKLYKGIHPNLGIPVALKALRMEYVTDKASCERFLKSARICAKLNHPNIVRVYDCGYDKDNVYLVMEFISGGSAQDLLEREGALDQHRAAQIAHDVCLGLMAAEYHGIVHRDIKPENIMFADDGTVKVLDMGLAKISGDPRISSYSPTISFTSLGTEQYMPPEQAIDASSCDSRADVYSLGITLYQLCTGRLPFESNNPQELRRMHALEPPRPPRELRPDLHPDLEYIILKCIRKNRDDRYQSIDELELDLDAFLESRILPSKLVYDTRGQSVSFFQRLEHVRWRYALLFLGAAALLSISTFYCFFSCLREWKRANSNLQTAVQTACMSGRCYPQSRRWFFPDIFQWRLNITVCATAENFSRNWKMCFPPCRTFPISLQGNGGNKSAKPLCFPSGKIPPDDLRCISMMSSGIRFMPQTRRRARLIPLPFTIWFRKTSAAVCAESIRLPFPPGLGASTHHAAGGRRRKLCSNLWISSGNI